MICMLNIVFDIRADNSCRLEHTKGVIDLTSLGRSDGSAAFPDIFPPDGSNFSLLPCFLLSETNDDRSFPIGYSYNPCKPFTTGTECVNVAACQSE